MSGVKEEEKHQKPPTVPHASAVRDHHHHHQQLMDFDLDFGAPWPFDQIFPSNPMSPFFPAPASSEQPCSPLWAFSDDDDDKPAGNATAAVSQDEHVFRMRSPLRSGNKRRLPPPNFGLSHQDYLDQSFMIKERMTQALRHFKASTEQHVLAQVWVPVKNGDHYVLTTSGQPFVLDAHSNGLHQYRMVSLMYMFSVDGDSDVDGLPARVFRQKLPEWTPDVQYYSSKEYQRLSHALNYNVRGSLALPVFEHSSMSCVGVIELIMTSQKINYGPEVDKVCKALEAVNLKSSEILNHPNSHQICNKGRQNALAEILEILTVVCETHKIPLAQTWVPCRHRSVLAYGGGFKKSCSSFDGSCMGQVCMSTTDVAFYIVDAHMWGFREACAEHHLQKGQGVAGQAFASRNSCFCEDISQFCKTAYPLVHYARMFGLTSSFAICLQSNHTGNDDYILEFFLPLDIRDFREQQTLLASLLVTMKQHFQSLKVASGRELEEEGRCVEILKPSTDEKFSPVSQRVTSPSVPDSLPNGHETLHHGSPESPLGIKVDVINGGGSVRAAGATQNAVSLPEHKEPVKKSERKRGKAEKTISLEVLQQYFAGSLKDAAKSLGVCPTTMKRICRQHGISRWPSRKINKVNRSLSKLKRVIESVQGAEGAFTLTSLATNSIPVNVGSMSWPVAVIESNQPNPSCPEPSTLMERQDELQIHKILSSHVQAEAENQILCDANKPNGLTPEFGEGSSPGSGGSREESTGTPISHGSYQGSPSPPSESSPHIDQIISSTHENYLKVGGLFELPSQPTGRLDLSAAFSIPDALVTTQCEETFGGMLVEDAGSSHDLRNLCPGVDELAQEHGWPNLPNSEMRRNKPSPLMPQFSSRPEVKIVTIKATYKDNIIRFRLPLDSGITRLKEEVAKRLKLEVGTFDIKYLDDDHEWVLIACDADLQECMDVSSSSENKMIRLSVHDITANLGSSVESSGE